MRSNHKVLFAAAGLLVAVLGGVWAAWKPIAALAAGGELFWMTRLALVASIGTIVGAGGVLRGYVPGGAALSLICGVVLLGTGTVDAGLLVVFGATTVFGIGRKPQPQAVREALLSAAR
jgi:hypothetical protein